MKNFLDKIEDINKDIKNINETIDGLLLSEQFNPLSLGFWGRRKLIDAIFGGDDEDVKDNQEKEERLKKSYEAWEESGKKEGDIEDIIDDVKDISNETDGKIVDDFRKILTDIAKKQKEIIEDALKKKGFNKITVKFNNPIDFTLKPISKENSVILAIMNCNQLYKKINDQKKIEGVIGKESDIERIIPNKKILYVPIIMKKNK